MKVFWFVLFGLALGNCLKSNAQGENNNWTFGIGGSGLTFNSSGPTFFQSSMDVKEGGATISDAFGNLLFYSSGKMVWDRNGNPMPNGSIAGNWDGSACQGVLILRSLSAADEFYVFTLDPMELTSYGSNKLRYSIVNMNLNNGLGDVRKDAKDIVVADAMEERMVAVESDDCGYWIVGHKKYTDTYVAVKLTSLGLQAPVYSSGITTAPANIYGSEIGAMTVSPDKTRIATMFRRNSIELATFNNSTGIISAALIINGDTFNNTGYGLAFSPDNTKLYGSVNTDSRLDQYNVALYPNAAAVNTSRIKILSASYWYGFQGMRLGPDKKIYLVGKPYAYLSAITYPNNSGLSCGLDTLNFFIPPSALPYYPYGYYGFGLGDPTVAITYKDTLPGIFVDTLICFSDSALLSVEGNQLSYTWSDAFSGASRYVHEDGIYYCLSSNGCTMRMDTFRVTFMKGERFDLGADTVICPGDSLIFSFSGDSFRWQDGLTDSVYVINRAGRYFLSGKMNGCSSADTLIVSVYDAGAVILEGDTLICKGEKVFLHGFSFPIGAISWGHGGSSEVTEVSAPGSYILEAENICGIFYDSVLVAIQDCNCQPGIPNAFSPNGDGLNDQFRIVLNCFASGFQLSVYNRFGERVFFGHDKDLGWDGRYKNQPADLGTYYYSFGYNTPNGESVKKQGDVILIR